MTVAIIYLVITGLLMWGSNWNYHPNGTHVLLAFGIIGICDRLNQLIKKKDGEPHV